LTSTRRSIGRLLPSGGRSRSVDGLRAVAVRRPSAISDSIST
jgi:hypothetical protein